MPAEPENPGSPAEVFWVALQLGLRSFGGPIAHLGYFRSEYVERRRWLPDDAFAEIVALTAFLPGPSSSQVGAAIGYRRAGVRGAAASWAGFTVPSAVVMGVCGILASVLDLGDQVWLRALKLVAVAVVLNAVLGMAAMLTTSVRTVAIAAVTALVVLALPFSAATQLACLVVAGLAGLALFRHQETVAVNQLPHPVSARAGLTCLVVFVAVLGLSAVLGGRGVLLEVFAAAYRAGALVFGGGHVVLPLLHARVVPGLMDDGQFLAGYGFAQAMPGPLFTFGTYVGAVAWGAAGAVVATFAIFAPGFLALFGVLPFWQRIRRNRWASAAMTGVNAAVVGLLAAAFVDPVLLGSVGSPVDAIAAALLFVLVRFVKVPAWLVVVIAVAASPLLSL